jgi:hypothetical protein
MLCKLLSFLLLTPLFSEEPKIDLYLFGLSKHTSEQNPDDHYKPYNDINPGIGIGFGLPMYTNLDGLISAGSYLDSSNRQNSFITPGIRYTYLDRACADLSLGMSTENTNPFGIWSIGIKPISNFWIHISYMPKEIVGDTSVWVLFARININ